MLILELLAVFLFMSSQSATRKIPVKASLILNRRVKKRKLKARKSTTGMMVTEIWIVTLRTRTRMKNRIEVPRPESLRLVKLVLQGVFELALRR